MEGAQPFTGSPRWLQETLGTGSGCPWPSKRFPLRMPLSQGSQVWAVQSGRAGRSGGLQGQTQPVCWASPCPETGSPGPRSALGAR